MKTVTRLVALFAFAGLGATAAGQDARRPNILLIMADDLGPEWISCCGADDIETLRIDQLAADGMRFRCAYSMPKCTPTRATLLTGQYPYRHGWVHHWDVPRWGSGCHFDPKHNQTFARALRAGGYATAIAGKWQINDFRVQPEVLAEHGFDEWCMWTGYETGNQPSAKRYADPYVHTNAGSTTREGAFGPDVFTDFAIDFMTRHRAKPWLCYYPMVLPHGPLVATPLAPDATGKMPRFTAMVRHVDHCVGRLLDALEALDLAKRTVVIFTTDNGTSRGITGHLRGRAVRGGKGQDLESGCRAPFVVRWPGVARGGAVSDALTDFTDLFPTLLEIGGVEPADGWHLDGHSIVDVLRGRNRRSKRDWIFAMGGGVARYRDGRVHPARPFSARVVRDRRWKLRMNADRSLELYDLTRDPDEQRNLVASDAAAARTALAKLRAVVEAMPRRDASPRYDPLPAQPWDRGK